MFTSIPSIKKGLTSVFRKLEASVPKVDVIATPGSLEIVVRVTRYINIIYKSNKTCLSR